MTPFVSERLAAGASPCFVTFVEMTAGGDPYHLTQKVVTELEAGVGCVNGKPTWRVRPR